MNWFCALLTSSIGKKVQVALAGLLLCGFLVSHLAGNLLLFGGAPVFNRYAHALESNPLLPAAEILLALLFLAHIVSAVKVRWENRKARPEGYQARQWAGGRTVGSATMSWTAALVLVFVVVHVRTFRFGDHSGDLHRFVLDKFQYAPYALFYLVSMAALALHLSHGFQSAFRSLGLEHPKYTPLVLHGGMALAAVLAGGFAAIVIWAGWMTGVNG